MRFDHIGVAAESLEAGRATLEALGVCGWTEAGVDPAQGVHYQFGRDGAGVRYEVLAPVDEHSPVARSVRTRSRTLAHVCYRVDDLDTVAAELVAKRWTAVSAAVPAPAFDGARIQFFLNPLGFVVELIDAT